MKRNPRSPGIDEHDPLFQQKLGNHSRQKKSNYWSKLKKFMKRNSFQKLIYLSIFILVIGLIIFVFSNTSSTKYFGSIVLPVTKFEHKTSDFDEDEFIKKFNAPCLNIEKTTNKKCLALYEFAKEMAEFWNTTNRPWFMMGGNAFNLLRMGTPGLRPENLADDDYDSIMLYKNEEDRIKIGKKLLESPWKEKFSSLEVDWHYGGCKEMTCMEVNPKTDSTNVKGSNMYSAFEHNSSHILVQANSCDAWFMPRERIFPLKQIKFGDLTLHVPNDFVYFYSHYPWDGATGDDPNIHYGFGCNKFAYHDDLYRILIKGYAGKWKFNRFNDHHWNLIENLDKMLTYKGKELYTKGSASFYEYCWL